MKIFIRIVEIIFAIPWLVFGTLHFLHNELIAGMVPAYFPLRGFWAYLTGAAMIFAALSFIFNKRSRLAAVLLGAMLTIFVLLIHLPGTLSDPSAVHFLHLTEEFSFALTAFMLAGILSDAKQQNAALDNIAKISRQLFAFFLIIFGIQHFTDINFPLAQIPPYLPFQLFWIYLTGLALTAAGISALFGKKAKLIVFYAGVFVFFINLLNHTYLLWGNLTVSNLRTAALLNLVINCGIFFLAVSSPDEEAATGNEF